jgi:glycosyltransferase involved in cell wall biosynthesis
MDVSIIIPAYNRLWSLPKAISSCFNTNLAVEVIVIDDGSTDGTTEWLQKQPNITIIRQSNQGKDWAVNAGFAVSTGKYIRFLDSDDWLLPFSTDELFALAEKDSLDVACAGYELVDENGRLLKEIKWVACDDFIAQQLGECDSSHYSAYLFKRTFIREIPHRQEFGALDDRKFIMEVALKNPVSGYIGIPSFAHRSHTRERLQNLSGLKESANHLARYELYKKTFAQLEESGELTPRRKSAACNILWHLAHWVAKTHLQEGALIYRWVYELNPAFVPLNNQGLHHLFKRLGFVPAQKLLRLRRLLNKND